MKTKHNTNKKHILLRYFFVIAGMLVFAGAIAYSMFKTSVINGAAWNSKAATFLDTTFSEPKRGLLLSENGTVLAASLDYYTVRIDWKAPGIKMDTLTKYLPALADSLHAFNPEKSASDYQKELLAEAKAKKKRAYRLFANLTAAEYNRLRTFPYLRLKSGENGLTKEIIPRRVKPYGGMAARSIGNLGDSTTIVKVRTVKDKDGKTKVDTVKHVSKHGISGLEKALDGLLYGKQGKKMPIQLPNRITQVETTPSIPGYNITTTINVAMQEIVDNELYAMCRESNAIWGTAVLMEVATGEIKAISNLEWNTDLGDYYEGVNHAMLGYEPGSVMKPISMMMALEDGIVGNPNAPIPMSNVFAYGNAAPITDSHPHGDLSAYEVIEHSSNVGMSKIILRKYEKNPIAYRQRLEEMGFFEPFNTGIAGEIVPWVSADMLDKKNGGCVNLTRMCYGYSTRIPPIYTLAMYNAIANDGKFVRPHLVKKLSRENEPDSIVPVSYVRKQVCSPQNAAILREMLHRVVWGAAGTARRWVQDSLVHIAGKTGTAYTISGGDYNTGEKRLAFCGFFPYEKPKYSCIVLLNRADRGAAASSGMVLKNIALKMYARGMLTDDADNTFIAKSAKTKTEPTMFASIYAKRQSALAEKMGAGNFKTLNKVNEADIWDPGRGVPDVKGMSIKEAVAILEYKGLQVRFSGSGYVSGQSLAAGTPFHRGDVIHLKLRH